MANEIFLAEVDKMFESYLSIEDVPQILIKDLAKNEILENINYSRIVFSPDLRIWKISLEGGLIPVDNPNFKAIVVKKK